MLSFVATRMISVLAVRGILMKDAQALRAADIEQVPLRLPIHVIVAFYARQLDDDLAVAIEDVQYAGRATGHEDALVFGGHVEGSIAVYAGRGPRRDQSAGGQVEDPDLLFISDVDVQVFMSIVDADRFNVVAGHVEVANELNLIDGQGRNLRCSASAVAVVPAGPSTHPRAPPRVRLRAFR